MLGVGGGAGGTGTPRAQGLGYTEAKGDQRSTGECGSSMSTIHLKL